jgi:hypothetical protein
MKQKATLRHFIVLISVLFLIPGCNREKAEAIKIAAEKFRVEATAAIEKINYLFTQSVSLPPEDFDARVKRIASDIEGEASLDSGKLSFIIQETDIGKKSLTKIDEELSKIANDYYQFENMFRSLPEGSFFASDAVKKAERHSINLTLQLINFANFLKNYPVQFTGQRTLILERIAEAKKMNDPGARREYLTLISKDILQLRGDEKKAQRDAVSHCLRAAEAGKLVSELIRNYDSMSVNDILITVKNSLAFISEISGNNEELFSVLENYNAIENSIRNDPYWNAILEEKITQ